MLVHLTSIVVIHNSYLPLYDFLYHTDFSVRNILTFKEHGETTYPSHTKRVTKPK